MHPRGEEVLDACLLKVSRRLARPELGRMRKAGVGRGRSSSCPVGAHVGRREPRPPVKRRVDLVGPLAAGRVSPGGPHG